MLADPKNVQTNLVGMLDLFDQVPQALRRTDREARLVVRRCKTVDANF